MSTDKTLDQLLADAGRGDFLAAKAALDLLKETGHEAEVAEGERLGILVAAQHASSRSMIRSRTSDANYGGTRDGILTSLKLQQGCKPSMNGIFAALALQYLIHTGGDVRNVLRVALLIRRSIDATVAPAELRLWADCMYFAGRLGILAEETNPDGQRLRESMGELSCFLQSSETLNRLLGEGFLAMIHCKMPNIKGETEGAPQ